MRFFLGLLTSLTLVASFVSITACSKDDSSDSDSSISGEEYSGPGSEYSLVMNDSAFELEESESGLAIKGTVETLASGFIKFTVGSSNMSDPSAGDQAYVLEVPGYMTLLKPIDSGDDQIITMVKSGDCPSSNLSLNWIITDGRDGADLDGTIGAGGFGYDSWGTYTWDSSTSVSTIPEKYDLDLANNADMNLGTPDTLGTFSCSNGVGQVSDAKMYFTPGGVIVNTNVSDDTDRSLIIGSSTTAITSLNNLDGNYIGLVSSDVDDDVKAVGMTASAGTFTVDEINVETGAATSAGIHTITISSGADTPSNGFMYGDIDAHDVTCMANIDVDGNGTDLIFCMGIDPAAGGDDTNRVTALFISN